MSVCVFLCVWGTGKAAKITAQQTTLMSNSDNGLEVEKERGMDNDIAHAVRVRQAGEG